MSILSTLKFWALALTAANARSEAAVNSFRVILHSPCGGIRGLGPRWATPPDLGIMRCLRPAPVAGFRLEPSIETRMNLPRIGLRPHDSQSPSAGVHSPA